MGTLNQKLLILSQMSESFDVPSGYNVFHRASLILNCPIQFTYCNSKVEIVHNDINRCYLFEFQVANNTFPKSPNDHL